MSGIRAWLRSVFLPGGGRGEPTRPALAGRGGSPDAKGRYTHLGRWSAQALRRCWLDEPVPSSNVSVGGASRRRPEAWMWAKPVATGTLLLQNPRFCKVATGTSLLQNPRFCRRCLPAPTGSLDAGKTGRDGDVAPTGSPVL